MEKSQVPPELGFMGRNAGLGHHFWVPISVLLQPASMTLGQILPCSSSASCLQPQGAGLAMTSKDLSLPFPDLLIL